MKSKLRFKYIEFRPRKYKIYDSINKIFLYDEAPYAKDRVVIYDDEDAKTELHLEIWKGQTKLNPEIWLFQK